MLSECSGWEVMCVMSLITGGATYYEKSIYLVLLPLLLLAVSHVLFLYNTRSIPPWYIFFSSGGCYYTKELISLSCARHFLLLGCNGPKSMNQYTRSTNEKSDNISIIIYQYYLNPKYILKGI